MRFRAIPGQGSRLLGITLLISSLVHIPLPQPDFHNVRHHDSPGEVCIYHDHLLRWHPSASRNEDVSMLHWHWFLPILSGSDSDNADPDDGRHRPGNGPWFHESLADSLEPDWSGYQSISAGITPCPSERLIPPPDVSLDSLAWSLTFASHLPLPFFDRAALPLAARLPRHLLLQRWNC